jgi:hypothetical protein
LKQVEEDLEQIIVEEEQILQEEEQILQGNDQSSALDAWIKGFESAIKQEIESSLTDLHRHRCATSDAKAQVYIQLLNDESELPC